MNETLNNVFSIITFVVLIHAIIFFLLFAVYSLIADIKTKYLRRDFYNKCSDEQKRLLDKYIDTNYYNYRRQLRRVKKNFHVSSKDE